MLFTAELANPKPIIIIIGPITTGGNSLLIQFVPINLIMNDTIMYTRPTTRTPVIAAAIPSDAFPEDAPAM